ncbi:hypothetical protein LY632_11625 [Erythrobacter sp. SDW2]|uniref:hypothetical protein n=1 Tax=Erythrobacter sp. SDW2 TaxID=2907154 RepID=UPI001F1B06D9|nr:hypothetical protein [Erythrobacter sp. SDW2]UIP06334.1 hypothetical protein LY632_11625 [Erythrobacter sp. SDW2]
MSDSENSGADKGGVWEGEATPTDAEASSGGLKQRFSSAWQKMEGPAQKVEARYLSALRYCMLAGATLLLVGATIYLAIGLFKQIGSSEITPEPVTIAVSDIAPSPSEEQPAAEAAADGEYKGPDKDLRARTLAVYRASFAKFERKGEAAKDEAVIDAVWPEERYAAFEQLPASDIVDSLGTPFEGAADLREHSITLAGKSVAEAGMSKALQSYRDAKKVRVCRDVTRQRKREVSYWNSNSTSCYMWYTYPYGCSDTRTVSEPYTDTVCEMRFPDDLESPAEAMGTAVENYLMVAARKIDTAGYDAEEKRSEILASKVEGRAQISDAGKLFLAFLGVMFLYLLVVMERHHRALNRLIKEPPSD